MLAGRKRLLVPIALVLVVLLIFIGRRTSELDPGFLHSPFDKDLNRWQDRLESLSPIRAFANKAVRVQLNGVSTSRTPAASRERLLILVPVRDAVPYLPKFFELLGDLTYPHDLIDLALLVSDSKDGTEAALEQHIGLLQRSKNAFHGAAILHKDFGSSETSQGVEDRHAFAYQAIRRKSLGRARNHLLAAALGTHHSWVLWLDVDIVEMKATLVEDLAAHDADITVPAIWFHRFNAEGQDIQGRFDYNSWVDSDTALELRKTLDPNVVLAEGYKEYETRRKYLCRLGDLSRDPHEEVELDGVGGVAILVKADVHRMGINFPAYAFENQAETEGFAKMARRAGLRVIGLPNYVVWHIDTEEKPGNAAAETSDNSQHV
ncbi:hypothetical protein PYCC9005_001404 [Savitreella phatthalungensis]